MNCQRFQFKCLILIVIVLVFHSTDASIHHVLKGKVSAFAAPKPIDESYWPQRFPAKDHCSKCGLCETTFVSNVIDSCAFLKEGMGKIDRLEEQVRLNIFARLL